VTECVSVDARENDASDAASATGVPSEVTQSRVKSNRPKSPTVARVSICFVMLRPE
jgi:hypothetical protein